MSSSPLFYDRVHASSTTTGTGTYTLGSAITGFQAFSVVGDGNSATYCAYEVDANGVPSGGWEVGIGTYTASGTTLSRDSILASSNSGAAVSWAAGTRRLFLTTPAALATPVISDFGGRLTLQTGVSVPTTDSTGATDLYYTVHTHNRLPLWNGSGWVRCAFTSDLHLALGTLTAGGLYDIFAYLNAGVPTLELSAAWNSNTTRFGSGPYATLLPRQDGVAVKSTDGTAIDATRVWLGSFRTVLATTTQDTIGGTTTQVGGQRLLYNAYNQVLRTLRYIDTTDNWSYTSSTVRGAQNQISSVLIMLGEAWPTVSARVLASVARSSPTTNDASVGVGVNTAGTMSGMRQIGWGTTGQASVVGIGGEWEGQPGLGINAIYWCEAGGPGVSCLFIGDDGEPDRIQSGLTVTVMM